METIIGVGFVVDDSDTAIDEAAGDTVIDDPLALGSDTFEAYDTVVEQAVPEDMLVTLETERPTPAPGWRPPPVWSPEPAAPRRSFFAALVDGLRRLFGRRKPEPAVSEDVSYDESDVMTYTVMERRVAQCRAARR